MRGRIVRLRKNFPVDHPRVGAKHGLRDGILRAVRSDEAQRFRIPRVRRDAFSHAPINGMHVPPASAQAGRVSAGELQAFPIWQAPWRQQGPKDPPQLENAAQTAACVLATSAW